MKLRVGRAFACLLLASAATALAQDKTPSAADLLFETPQLANTKPGDELNYSYSQKSADPAKYGASFDDTIKLTIEDAGHAANERKVSVDMFPAARRRAAGPFEDMSGNPVIMLMLENDIERLSSIFGANPRYFKQAIRRALREASSEPDKIEGQAQAWKVEVAPFKNDPQKERMGGLESVTYVFRVAPDLPGAVYEIDIGARDASGALLIEETLRYEGKKS
jgi:hypothetical protein